MELSEPNIINSKITHKHKCWISHLIQKYITGNNFFTFWREKLLLSIHTNDPYINRKIAYFFIYPVNFCKKKDLKKMKLNNYLYYVIKVKNNN